MPATSRFTASLPRRRHRGALLLTAVMAVLVSALAPVPPAALAATPSGHDLHVSLAPDRSGAVALEGQVLSGNVYIFVAPEAEIRSVRFWVDDPSMSGSHYRKESNAPYDLEGGRATAANPFDVSALGAGDHRITIEVTRSDWATEITTATFTVDSTPPPPPTYELLTSATADRAAPEALDGATVSGDIHVFVSPEHGVSRVQFALDDPANIVKTENSAPWDLAGGGKNAANPYSTLGLADGPHTLYAHLTLVDSTATTVHADFTVDNTLVNALIASPTTVTTDAVSGGGVVVESAEITASDAANVPLTISDDADWLTVVGAGGEPLTTPVTLDITIDPAALGGGSHAATIDISSDGYSTTSIAVTVNVTDPAGFSLVHSPAADRLGPVSLDGATVGGDIYAFVSPESGIKRVQFALDDPANIVKTENSAPWDLAGGGKNAANPYSTLGLADGPHTLYAHLTLVDSTATTVHADFTVDNAGVQALLATPTTISTDAVAGGPTVVENAQVSTSDGAAVPVTLTDDAAWLDVSATGGGPLTTPLTLDLTVDPSSLTAGAHAANVTVSSAGYDHAQIAVTVQVSDPIAYDLMVSLSPDRADPVPVEGTTVSGPIYVFVAPESGISSVEFFIDDPTMAGLPVQIEWGAPYDLAGTESDGTANPFNANSLGNGPHELTANITLSGGGSSVVTSTFTKDPSCTPVPCGDVLVDLPFALDWSADHGFIVDGAGVGTGFTWIDPPSASAGYLPENLSVDPTAGTLSVLTTDGAQHAGSQDNALSVGIDQPSQITEISTTIVDPPPGSGNHEQAGLWWGNDEDNYIKLVVRSSPNGGLKIEGAYYLDGNAVSNVNSSAVNLAGRELALQLRADPNTQSVALAYSVDGGLPLELVTFEPETQLFSFDGAGIDQTIGTNTFTGIIATHRFGPSPLTYTFTDFAIDPVLPELELPVEFDRRSYVPNPFSPPTSMEMGPDGRLYVATLFGEIHALAYDADWNVIDDEVITTVADRLMLGLTLDPASVDGNVILWVTHSNPSLNQGEPNSGTVSRLEQANAWSREDVILGLPRAEANHGTNSLHFAPDGRLWIAQGGNTGGGAPNSSETEFGDFEEQPLSAAILVVDLDTATDLDCNNPDGDIFGDPQCDVEVLISGVRNMYDFMFHSNGEAYGPDNGLGVLGTYPPSPTAPCFGFGDTALWTEGGHNPGSQPDRLYRLVEGGYYGHPNPYRDECVFLDGHYQGVAPLPNFTTEILNLGDHRSANGIVEYQSDAFCGAYRHDLLITNYSAGDGITRVQLTPDGQSVTAYESFVADLDDPLPLDVGPDGVLFVGELGNGQVTVLVPSDTGCWSEGAALPQNLLDAGGDALDGKLYVVGGKFVGGSRQSTVYLFDSVSETWSTVADLPGEAVENPAVISADGKLYVFGGSTEAFSGAVSNSAVFDPATGAWTTLAPMPNARGGPTAEAVDGLIYVMGGMDPDGNSLDTVDVYDPTTDSWAAGVPMQVRRDNPGSAVFDGRIYVFGGRTRNADSTTPDPTLSSVEMFDPTTGAWTFRASMPTGRRTMVVGTVNGRAQVMGGEIRPDGGAFADNEEYDPVTDTWRVLNPMPTGRHGAAAGTIDGAVHVVSGGVVGGFSDSDVHEVFTFPSLSAP